MGIRIGAIFLMITLVAGFTSFPSSLSNYSTEIVDQPHSLNLINTAFADSDDDEDEEDYEDDEDGEKGKPAGVGNGKPEGVGKDKEKKLTENQAKDDDDEYEIEIDVEVEDGVATVEIEIDDEEFEFEFILTATDPDDIREEIENEILARTDLTIEQLSFLEIEFEDEYEDEDYEDDIQEFNDATVVHMSGTTKICHVPPGNPGNAHFITIGEPAVSAHERHGDFDVLGLCAENGMEYVLSNKEIKQAQKLTRLTEKQTEKESMALDRANKLIEKLEQRIAQLEQRLQTLLNKVESGEYYGTLTQLDTVTQSHSISFDGTATSIYDESVTTELSGEIFIENLMTGSNTSKFKVTGGDIIIGDNIYDAAFGKVRVSSLGVEGEKDSLVVIIQTFDSEDNDNTIKLTLLFDFAITADLGTEPISFEIKPNSKISKQWFLSGSGTISLE